MIPDIEFSIISDEPRAFNPTKGIIKVLEEVDNDNILLNVILTEFKTGGTIVEDTIKPYNKALLNIIQRYDFIERKFVVDFQALATALKSFKFTLQP